MAIGDTAVGTIATGGPTGENASRLGREISDKITFLGSNIAPLVRLGNMKKQSVARQEFIVLEDGDRPITTTENNGTVTAGTTTITVNNATRGRKFDIWMIEPTKEHILLTEDGGATTWANVVRGYGTTAAAGFTQGDTLRWIGNAVEEKGSAITSLQTVVQTRTNYTQFFIERTALTEIDDNSSHEGGLDERQRQRQNTRRAFLRGMESSFLWGEPLKEEEGQSPKWSGVDMSLYKTGGFLYWCDQASTNYDAGGALSWFDFTDIVADITRDAPENMGNDEVRLMAMCGKKAAMTFNQWPIAQLQTKMGENKYGMNLQTIQTPFGVIGIHQHHLLTGSEFEDYVLLVNPMYVGYRYHKNMDIRLVPNVQDKDTSLHVLKDELYGVLGFYLTQASLHAYIKNVSMAV